MPAAPIAGALRKWVEEHQGLNEAGGDNADRTTRCASAYEVLGGRLGLKADTIYAHAYKERHSHMAFDVADRLLCAIDQVSLWWQDPVLAEVYEEAVIGADRIYPIARAA